MSPNGQDARSGSKEKERRRREPSPLPFENKNPRSRKYEEKPPRSPSPQVDEYTRDQRTVFVFQLAQRLKQHELREFFEQAGRVKDARIVTDKHSRRSKGVGYVEFYEESSVDKAILLTGQKLLGIPVIVQRSEAEKNRIAEQNAALLKMPEPTFNRLYIGSIHFNLTEDDLRLVFEPFGELEFVNIQRDPDTGRSRGYGFIQYKNAADAKQALDKMNGFDLAGRPIKVGLVTEKGTAMPHGLNLDDNEVAGVALTSQSRVELMQKLARDPTPYQSAVLQPTRPVVPVMNSKCIILKNMFDPEQETESNWDKALEDDVVDECSRYGRVLHCHVEKDSSTGEVYAKFGDYRAADAAVNALNGRWFGGRQVSASTVPEGMYHVRFPKAAHL